MSDPEGTLLRAPSEASSRSARRRSAQRSCMSAAPLVGSARLAGDLLQSNTAVTSEARRVVTELREAGAVLNLMRQTKMDEATIHCAIFWAQGCPTIHLNVKFAGRLDAPVTVRNVDNEEVRMNETLLSGIGQKPAVRRRPTNPTWTGP